MIFTTCLYARFAVTKKEVRTIRDILQVHPKTDRRYRVELCDRAGVVHAICDKTVHVRRRVVEKAAAAAGSQRVLNPHIPDPSEWR